MWTREELKFRAKEVLRNCYWAAVVVALIAGILSGRNERTNVTIQQKSYNQIQDGGSSLIDSGRDVITNMGDNLQNVWSNPQYLVSRMLSAGFGIVILGLGVAMVILGIAIGILVGNPMQVGACRFFMCARERTTRIGEIVYAFRQREFWNVVLIMLVMNVKIFLWSLLFVIPGIVKSFEYGMIPYILAENPGIAMSEAFALSREMTYGEKMNIFILELSFLPWQILSSFTCGLVGVFWVRPYMSATKAELYALLRWRVLDSGFTNSYTLPGFGE